MNTPDTQPWYRQFWPWFLIALPATAVLASLFTVVLATRTTDSLVTDADEGMDVITERHLAAESRARSMGLSATLAIDAESGAITAIAHSDQTQQWPRQLNLELSHPTIAARDQAVSLTKALPSANGEPVWVGHFVQQPGGRWYIVLTPDADDREHWRLNGTWSGEPEVRLRPASDET